jgi:hypothetical protein
MKTLRRTFDEMGTLSNSPDATKIKTARNYRPSGEGTGGIHFKHGGGEGIGGSPVLKNL